MTERIRAFAGEFISLLPPGVAQSLTQNSFCELAEWSPRNVLILARDRAFAFLNTPEYESVFPDKAKRLHECIMKFEWEVRQICSGWGPTDLPIELLPMPTLVKPPSETLLSLGTAVRGDPTPHLPPVEYWDRVLRVIESFSLDSDCEIFSCSISTVSDPNELRGYISSIIELLRASIEQIGKLLTDWESEKALRAPAAHFRLDLIISPLEQFSAAVDAFSSKIPVFTTTPDFKKILDDIIPALKNFSQSNRHAIGDAEFNGVFGWQRFSVLLEKLEKIRAELPVGGRETEISGNLTEMRAALCPPPNNLQDLLAVEKRQRGDLAQLEQRFKEAESDRVSFERQEEAYRRYLADNGVPMPSFPDFSAQFVGSD
jgi:hypothetical protein